MDANNFVREDLEGIEEHGREKLNHLREHLNNHKQTFGGNMDSKNAASNDSEGTCYYKLEESCPCYI